MSSSSASSNKCAVCSRAFGMMLWKHTCDVCRKTVCDDCAPRNTDSVGADGAATKLRVCQACGSTGRRLGDANETAEAPRADPNSEAERARRMAAIEARNKSQQSRGRPQGGAALSRPTPVSPAPAPASPPPPTTTTTASGTPAATSPAPAAATPPASSAANTNAAAPRPSNPALEAALRRQQQQQQLRGGSAAAAQAASMSPEKVKLLREIDALMEKHREEAPFGLRASDETKLKGYLHYLKTKYNVKE